MRRKLTILISETNWLPLNVEKRLSFYFKIIKGPFSKKKINELFYEVDGILIGLDHYIDFDMNKSKIKFIACPSTGKNHISKKILNNYRIKKFFLSDNESKSFLKKIDSTAELVFVLAQILLRNIDLLGNYKKYSNHKNKNLRSNNIGRQLKNLTIGIVGFGRIGKILTRISKFYEMNILLYDNKKTKNNRNENYVSFDNLLKLSDIVTINVDLNDSNINLFTLNEFKKMKKDAILINTSRGEVINEKDLLYALKNKLIYGAGLDVLKNEYKSDNFSSKLIEYSLKNKNLIITPHIGGLTEQSLEMVSEHITERLINWYQNDFGYFKKIS